MENNPWTARFEHLTEAAIIARARHDIEQLTWSVMESPTGIAVALERHLAELYEPSPNGVTVLVRLVRIAEDYCRAAYPDRESVLRHVYSGAQAEEPRPIYCVTGLAGVGKSALFAAFCRVLGRVGTVDVDAGHRFPLRAAWHLKVRHHKTSATILAEMLTTLAPSASASVDLKDTVSARGRPKNAGDVDRLVRLLCYRDGLCAIVLDELQFLSQSAQASTQLMSTILRASYVGAPLSFGANYDMVWKLKARGQQDRDRALARPIVMLPDEVDTPEGRHALSCYLLKCIEASGGLLEFDPVADCEAIHGLSYGVRRKILRLFAIAVECALSAGRRTAEMADLDAAYCSAEFQMHREDIELLLARDCGGTFSGRRDLLCPFELPPGQVAAAKARAQGVQDEQLADAALAASLSPAERKALARVSRVAQHSQAHEAKRRHRSKATKVSLDEFARNVGRAKHS